ncbi:MAG: hypothetical protein RLZ37_1221 [Actinomycetota bacterium]
MGAFVVVAVGLSFIVLSCCSRFTHLATLFVAWGVGMRAF